MSAGDLLRDVRHRDVGVKVGYPGGFLELDAPAGVVCEELLSRVSRTKPELLELLEEEAAEKRELPSHDPEVLPELRDMLSCHPQMIGFPPDYLALNLTIFGTRWNVPPVAEVEAALEVLDIERGAA